MEPENDHDRSSRLPRARWDTDDEALAYYLTTARYGGGNLPSSLQAELEAIDRAARRDPVFAARLDALARRLEMLDGDGAHRVFDQLTGRREQKPQAQPTGKRGDRPSRTRTRRLVRPSTAAVLLIVLLFAAGGILTSRTPEFADLASLDPFPISAESAVILRGGAESPDEILHLKLRYAHELLVNAENRLFGRVLGYDDQKVDEALRLLNEVVRQSEHPEIRTTGRYLSAKGLLTKGDAAAARRHLLHASRGAGADADRAALLLERLRSRAGN